MFSDVLRELRTNKGLTQSGLAQHLGVTQQAIGRWEKALTSPDYETLKRIASFFNVSTDYLLGNNPTNLPKPLPLRITAAISAGLIVPFSKLITIPSFVRIIYQPCKY